MGTKLKKISRSFITKLIAFLLAVVCFGIAVTTMGNVARTTVGTNVFEQKDFVSSSDLFHYRENFLIGLDNLLKYKNVDYIKQGNTISKEEFQNRKMELFNQWYMENYGNQNISINNPSVDENGLIVPAKTPYQLLKDKFEADNADKISQIYNEMIQEQLAGFYSLLQRVNNKEGLVYYATDGENTYTNTNQTSRDYFAKYKAYYLLDKDGVKVYPQTDILTNIYPSSLDFGAGNTIYVSASDEYISKMQAKYDMHGIYFRNSMKFIIPTLLVLISVLVYLMWVAGRKEEDENVNMMLIDRLYTDINVALIIAIVSIWITSFISVLASAKFLNYIIYDMGSIRPDFWIVLLISSLFCSVGLALLLSLVRHIKNRTLIRHSLLYTIFSALRKALKSVLSSGPLSLRLVGIILGCEIVVVILSIFMGASHTDVAALLALVLLAINVVGIYYVIRKIKSFSGILKGIEEIKKGNLESAITVEGEGELAALAGSINDIASGLKSAVEKEIKSERMKSELITNVSHDLKTPLTSIINYVDLLSKEKLVPEEANDYVAVLKQKSEKLKVLTQDLFEVTKAQCGNIKVDLEKIDAKVLIKQSLAEYEEQISSSKLDFKVNLSNFDAFIMADGKKMSRVFENLIGNILKYSLAGTRVYVDLFTNENNVVIEFKNIANYEMNFKEDEILERFTRGDKSRTTDGHGLGLAIAESYVNACGGSLKISIDGDLFKATIKFDRA